jgi:uracil-DNA glycosylase
MNARMLTVLALFGLGLAASGCSSAEEPVADEETSDESELVACGPVEGADDRAAATRLWAEVPAAWRTELAGERGKDYFPKLAGFVAAARARQAAVFPAEADTFTALTLADPGDVQVVILGQDPYIKPGQAHGLAFSVKPPTAPPPSLRNIFKELQADLPAITPVNHGSLEAWAKQGVLLLNAVLTVEEGKSGSHACKGWETFTDAIIRSISARRDKVVFVLWGSFAQSKIPLIDPRHVIIQGAHPSPLSAHRGFLGSRPFSKVNAALAAQKKRAIDWQLPAQPSSSSISQR